MQEIAKDRSREQGDNGSLLPKDSRWEHAINAFLANQPEILKCDREPETDELLRHGPSADASVRDEVRCLFQLTGQLLSALPDAASIIFVGNGMRPVYEAARYLDEDGKIVWLRFSKDLLSDRATFGSLTPEQSLARYIETLGVVQSERGIIYLVDTVGRKCPYDYCQRTLFVLRDSILQISRSVGVEEARDIVPVGLPEFPQDMPEGQYGPQREPNLADAITRLRSGDSHVFFDPCLKAEKLFGELLLCCPRWNGYSNNPANKFRVYDEQGVPSRSQNALRSLCEDIPSSHCYFAVADIIRNRASFLVFFRELHLVGVQQRKGISADSSELG